MLWQARYSVAVHAYHQRALHNYFLPRHTKYSGQHNPCDIRAAHDGKVGCNTNEYSTSFLYSDWLYFLWRGINIQICIVSHVLSIGDKSVIIFWIQKLISYPARALTTRTKKKMNQTNWWRSSTDILQSSALIGWFSALRFWAGVLPKKQPVIDAERSLQS